MTFAGVLARVGGEFMTPFLYDPIIPLSVGNEFCMIRSHFLNNNNKGILYAIYIHISYPSLLQSKIRSYIIPPSELGYTRSYIIGSAS